MTIKQMETMQMYRLTDMMRFLASQRKKGYQDLNVLLEHFEDDRQEELRKLFGITIALRYMELHEINFDDPSSYTQVSEEAEKFYKKALPPRWQFLDVPITNGVLRADYILN